MASTKASLRGLDAAKQARLDEIHNEWAQFPGRAIHGTGPTGLMPNDATGYSNMLNEQTEAMNLENEASGAPPVQVRYGGEYTSQGPGIAGDPASSYNTTTGPYGAFGTGTGGQSGSMLSPVQSLAGLSTQPKAPLPESHEAFMAKLVKQYGKRG